MNDLRDYVWLLLGAIAALVVGFTDAGVGLAEMLRGLLPIPWVRIGLALLVFGSAAALHFRLQLVRSLERNAAELERQRAGARLIGSAVTDGRRWLLVIQENLELVADEELPSQARLYLDGARAHADKLEQAFERIEGNQSALDRQPR